MKHLLILLLLLVSPPASAADQATERLAVEGTLGVGETAPWLAGWTLLDEVWSLDTALADSTVQRLALVFWATWCAPCKAGLERLATASERLDAGRISVVLVNLDRRESLARSFLAEQPSPFLTVLDPFQRATRDFFGLPADGDRVLTLPRTVLLDRNGVVEAILGREGEDYLDILLAPSPPPR